MILEKVCGLILVRLSSIAQGVRPPVPTIDRARTTDEAAVFGYMSLQTVAGFDGESPCLFSGPVQLVVTGV
jgi:hypothetical protein